MKIEPRGKYPGVKIHLDEKEVEEFLGVAVDGHLINTDEPVKSFQLSSPFVKNLRVKVKNLIKERPNLLKERTQEEIVAELTLEKQKSETKLAAIAAGKDWKS